MFLNLANLTGFNSDAVAYYEYHPSQSQKPTTLNIVLTSGAMVELEGSEASQVYEALKSLPVNSFQRQTALETLGRFVDSIASDPQAQGFAYVEARDALRVLGRLVASA